MTDVPPPTEEWKAEEPWEDDTLAQLEDQTDPLDAQILEQDKRNRLQFKKASGRLIVWSTYLFWAILVAGLMVWCWHYLTPWPFLTEPQLSKVQSVIFSGTLGAVVSSLAKGYLSKD